MFKVELYIFVSLWQHSHLPANRHFLVFVCSCDFRCSLPLYANRYPNNCSSFLCALKKTQNCISFSSCWKLPAVSEFTFQPGSRWFLLCICVSIVTDVGPVLIIVLLLSLQNPVNQKAQTRPAIQTSRSSQRMVRKTQMFILHTTH